MFSNAILNGYINACFCGRNTQVLRCLFWGFLGSRFDEKFFLNFGTKNANFMDISTN
jgi:hypothetical protein